MAPNNYKPIIYVGLLIITINLLVLFLYLVYGLYHDYPELG
ncbi:uncharacterized protein YoxC [Pedobacter sp. SG908]|nr:uncharacterized protein YoxC [Pedobacter sp. SG908]